MVYIQQYEHGQFANQPNHRKLGSGSYLNPYYGKGCNSRNGYGFADVFSSLINTGTNFIKNHGSTIANVANIASGAANTIKAIKEIKNNDEKLYELKRIKQKLSAANTSTENTTPKISKASLDILDKIKKTGNGLKVI